MSGPKPIVGKISYAVEADGSPAVSVNLLDDQRCCHIIRDRGADGTVDDYSAHDVANTRQGMVSGVCHPMATGPLYAEGVRFLMQRAGEIIDDAIKAKKLHRADMIFFSPHVPRSVAHDEWGLEGKIGQFRIQIIGNADGVLYLRVSDDSKDIMFRNDVFLVNLLDSGARRNPLLSATLRRMFDHIQVAGLDRQTTVPVAPKTKATLQAVPSLAAAIRTLPLQSTVEHGGTCFVTGDRHLWHRWPTGDEGTIHIPVDVALRADLIRSDHIVDVHVHPAGESFFNFPSTMDFRAIAQRLFLLDRFGFKGNYLHQVITPVGIYTILPNLLLLRKDPEQFYQQYRRSADVDGIRLHAENPQAFLKEINGSSAYHVHFEPTK